MQKFLYLAALALAVAAIVPVAALADDPLAAIKADITQLQTDVKTKHDAVLADAQTLQTDAQTLVGTDKATAKAKIKIDVLKLTGDWRSLLSVCLSDRAKLHDRRRRRPHSRSQAEPDPAARPRGQPADPRLEPRDAGRCPAGPRRGDRSAPELQERRADRSGRDDAARVAAGSGAGHPVAPRYGRNRSTSSSASRSFGGGSLTAGPRWISATTRSFAAEPERLADRLLGEARGCAPVRGEAAVRRAEQDRVDGAGGRVQVLLVDVRIAREARRGEHERRRPAELHRLLLARELLDPARGSPGPRTRKRHGWVSLWFGAKRARSTSSRSVSPSTGADPYCLCVLRALIAASASTRLERYRSGSMAPHGRTSRGAPGEQGQADRRRAGPRRAPRRRACRNGSRGERAHPGLPARARCRCRCSCSASARSASTPRRSTVTSAAGSGTRRPARASTRSRSPSTSTTCRRPTARTGASRRRSRCSRSPSPPTGRRSRCRRSRRRCRRRRCRPSSRRCSGSRPSSSRSRAARRRRATPS